MKTAYTLTSWNEIAFYSRETFKPIHRLLLGMKGPSTVVLIENETAPGSVKPLAGRYPFLR